MSPKRITYKDVAEHAGVSVATVSYVLNNGPRPVSAATRRRVERVIDELGYYPNEVARSLRLQQSSTIGLMIPNATNPVYAEIARELERICSEAGFVVLLCNSDRQAVREEKFVQTLRAKGVDGVVLLPHQQPEALLEPLRLAHIPTVVLEHDLPNVHCVCIAEEDGGRIATQHLIDLGHRRIAHIRRHPTSAQSTLRIVGYRSALAAADIPYDPALIFECGPGHAAGTEAMQRLLMLSNPPTAVFTHNDVLAIGAMHAVHGAGLSVPRDISVVGYDDIASAAFFNPPLTTVRHPKAEIGTLAAHTLLRLIQRNEPTQPQTVVVPVELIVRGSTAAVQ
ncbi:MAG TPA: LacI family DNA-binding transcriptional regulator [Caldilineaceae bacterium]|nr:LacI family DNA-binding transcriptional regulator [Caldilineaceae bacterium]